MEARPCSSVEGLCLALERAASGSDRDAASALPNLIRAAHREVGKLRHLAEALNAEIAFLQADTEPYSRVPVSAGVPVAAVLELAGGRATALGIKEGDRVAWGGCAVSGDKVTT